MQVVSFGCCVLDVCYIGYIRLVISYWCCVYVRGDNAPGNVCPWTFLPATCSQQMSYAEVECAEETFLLAETDRIALWTFYGQKIRKYFPQILSRTWMKIKKKQQEQQQHKVAAAVVFFFLYSRSRQNLRKMFSDFLTIKCRAQCNSVGFCSLCDVILRWDNN